MSKLNEKAEDAVECDSAAALRKDDAESDDIENECNKSTEHLNVCLFENKVLYVIGNIFSDKSADEGKSGGDDAEAVKDNCKNRAEGAAALVEKTGHCR